MEVETGSKNKLNKEELYEKIVKETSFTVNQNKWTFTNRTRNRMF